MRTISFLTTVAVIALSAGCASTGGTPVAASQKSADLQPDYELMARVEQVARKRGVHVAWVNPPQVQDRPTP